MNLDKKYILVSNRGPDLILGEKEHKAKGGTKNAYKSIFENFCFKWFFILPKDYFSDFQNKNLNPIFIENKIYNLFYYKYISEFLYLNLLGLENKNIDFQKHFEDFENVNSKILNKIKNYNNIILCDYHLYNLPKKLSGKNIIYFWFIPFLEIENYNEKETIKNIVFSLNFCEKIIFLNRKYLENFQKLFKYFFPNENIKPKLEVNLLGADNFFISEKIEKNQNKKIKFGMISRLDPVKNILNTIKGYELFLKENDFEVEFEILAEYHRQESVFYKKYEKKILEFLEKFEFKNKIKINFGHFSKKYLKSFYEKIDIFVCLSFYDGMPLTVLEFILTNKYNNYKKILFSKNIGSYDLLKNVSGTFGINPISLNDIKNGFFKILNNNFDMEKAFDIVSKNTFQNWKENNNKILGKNKIILLGSGDTLGTPVVGCNCEICQIEKRTRFGIFITYNGKNILIDTNPDLKYQFLENKLDYKDIDYIFITHTHTDHINGLGELSFRKSIPLYYPDDDINSRNMNYFNYLEWEKVIKKIPYKNFEEIILENDIKILPLSLNHGFPTSGFVIFLGNIKIGICSDTNLNLDEKVLEKLKNCDYLFFDGFSDNKEQILELYKQIGEEKTLLDLEKIWFHTTIEELKNLKNILNPKNMIVVHISHIAGKHNSLQEKYGDLIIGKDGLSFSF